MKVYEKVYGYFVEQIAKGALKPGDRMPSIRSTEKFLGVSRTTVETAYLQMAADGYIYSVEKVGYFISNMTERNTILDQNYKEKRPVESKNRKEPEHVFKYDLATIGEDRSVSCLDLWRRYMKSALRQEERLLSYAQNQGEDDLRLEISHFVRKHRNIICSPEDIVIGAGFQNLLQILIPLISGERTISFPTRDFMDGAVSFQSAGFQVNFRDKESHVIYVTPAYMTKWGEVMTMKRRRELVEHVTKNNHLLIEDDYQNEFVYSSKPTPSLYALTGGENVAYLGSFSRLLLPSVRISYLILPRNAREDYHSIRDLYNQTASKAEQIALAQFLRDGHLIRHIKKIKRLYEEKRNIMQKALIDNFSGDSEIYVGDSGMEMGLLIKGQNIIDRLKDSDVSVNVLWSRDNETFLLLSCSRIESENIATSITKLNESLHQ